VKDATERRLNGIFDRIADQLGSGPWLLQQTFSAADLYLFMLIRWGRAMPRPPRTLAPLGGLAERVLARPAVQAALAAEGLQPPFV
jgi:glutathione S-transferase